MLSISGLGTTPGSATGIIADVQPGSGGNAGKVTVTAGALSIVSNGQISSATFGPGTGGSVAVSVAGNLVIDGARGDPFYLTGISSEANKRSTGNAGSVTVSAGNLAIVNNGQISGVTFGRGDAGSVTVDVADRLLVDNTGGDPGFLTGINSKASSGSTGKAGSVAVTAGKLALSGGGLISSATFGAGDGGSVIVNAGTLTINPNSVISADTFAAGKGGDVTVTVAGTLSIDGTASTTRTGISAGAAPTSTGNAGNVIVNAGNLRNV